MNLYRGDIKVTKKLLELKAMKVFSFLLKTM